jgi:hypothetical protein
VITNPGNTLSSLVSHKDLGAVFPFGDDRAMADAVARMAAHPAEMRAMRRRIAEAKKALHWHKALKPLVRFFKNPHKAAPVFNDALGRLSFYELNRQELKRVLFLRSAPMTHCAEALKALKSVAPEAAIDVVIQPGVDAAALGEGVNLILLPGNGFQPEHASVADGKGYDAVVCAFNTSDVRFYANVAGFAAKIPAKRHWAFGHDYQFMDIAPLLEQSAAKRGKPRRR